MQKKPIKKASSKVKTISKEKNASGKPKKAAGSTLSQNASRRSTSPKVAKKASAILRDGRSSTNAKTVAGSALSQVQNPRTGRYVKIDSTSGSILSHKKSRGAYKNISIMKSDKSITTAK